MDEINEKVLHDGGWDSILVLVFGGRIHRLECCPMILRSFFVIVCI